MTQAIQIEIRIRAAPIEGVFSNDLTADLRLGQGAIEIGIWERRAG
jgi:hypothetical protein